MPKYLTETDEYIGILFTDTGGQSPCFKVNVICICYCECPQLVSAENHLVNVDMHLLNW
jgi:hypothetical protein